MVMSKKKDPLSSTFIDVYEIERFFMQIAKLLPSQERHFKVGQDIAPYLKERHIQVPDVLQGESIEWLGHDNADDHSDVDVLSLVRPGDPLALGLTVGCVKIRRWKVCLECGWFWCRIVIKGSFLTT
jgi:hypothetical protein